MSRAFAELEKPGPSDRASAIGANDVAGPTDEPAISVVEVIAGIHRIALGETTVGYVQYTGDRFVSLLGAVYNTSVEVAQTLSLDAAVRRLLLA